MKLLLKDDLRVVTITLEHRGETVKISMISSKHREQSLIYSKCKSIIGSERPVVLINGEKASPLYVVLNTVAPEGKRSAFWHSSGFLELGYRCKKCKKLKNLLFNPSIRYGRK